MTSPRPVVARAVDFTGDRPGRQVWTWCPACDTVHPFTVRADPTPAGGPMLNNGQVWAWNENLEAPTFSPSLLVHAAVHLCADEHGIEPCPNPRTCGAVGHPLTDDDEPGHRTPHTREPAYGDCHSYLVDGVWEFLADSAHHLAGQRVPMVPLPGAWGRVGERP